MIKFVVLVSLCVALTLAQTDQPQATLKRVARQMSGMPSNLGEMPGMGVDMMRQGARIGLGMMNPGTWLNEGKEIMEKPGGMRKRREALAQEVPGGMPPMPDGMPPMPPAPPMPSPQVF